MSLRKRWKEICKECPPSKGGHNSEPIGERPPAPPSPQGEARGFPVTKILDLVNKKFPDQSLIIVDSFLNRLKEIWKQL